MHRASPHYSTDSLSFADLFNTALDHDAKLHNPALLAPPLSLQLPMTVFDQTYHQALVTPITPKGHRHPAEYPSQILLGPHFDACDYPQRPNRYLLVSPTIHGSSNMELQQRSGIISAARLSKPRKCHCTPMFLSYLGHGHFIRAKC